MREILFRGKRIDNRGWVEGSYCPREICRREDEELVKATEHLIIAEMTGGSFGYAVVDEKTVCQYTGLTDRNGRKIFEGDIVSAWSEGSNAKGRVKQRVDGLWIMYPAWQNQIMWGLCPNGKGETTDEVIGNIFDNPELLEEQ